MAAPAVKSPAMNPIYSRLFTLSAAVALGCGYPLLVVPAANAAAPPVGGNVAVVPDLIREALRSVEEIPDIPSKTRALTEIGTTRAKAGNLAGAKQSWTVAVLTAHKAPNAHDIPGLLKEIAVAQAGGGDKDGARITFNAAKQEAEQQDEFGAKVDNLLEIAEARRTVGDGTGADLALVSARRLLTEERQTADQNPNDLLRAGVLATIVGRQARSGDGVGAKTAADSIVASRSPSHGYQKSLALWGLVDAELGQNDFAGALATKDQIINDYIKGRAVLDIALAQARHDQIDNAKVSAAFFGDPFLKSIALCGIVEAQARAGKLTDAQQTMTAITDKDAQGNARFAIAGAQAKARDTAGALQTAAWFTDPEGVSHVRSVIAVAQAQSGDAAGARETAQGITSPYWKTVTAARIALSIVSGKPTPAK